MFEDLKVVELASVLAGPLVGSFFSELGARVVKIENAQTNGDVTRGWKLPSEDEDAEVSAYYASANYNKEVRFLNLKESGDYDLALAEIRNADIVISNYKPGGAERLGLDYETLKKVKRDIIYASLTGFGETNSRAAFDVVLQAESGFMYMNGEPEGTPVKMPVALIDVLAAHHLKEAVLCALIRKLKTGKGKLIEVSLYDSAIASLVNQGNNWLMAKHIPQKMGSAHPNIAPYGDMYSTADGRLLVLAVGSEKQFEALAKALNFDNSSYATNQQRVANRSALNKEIGGAISKLNASEWETVFGHKQIPYGIVRNMKEVFESPLAQKQVLQHQIENVAATYLKTALI